jgi:hypothetical protein
MAHYSAWVSYSGTDRVVLAIVLFIAAGGAAYAGTRLPLPARAPRPGQKAANFMLAAWIAAMTAFLGCVAVLVQQARRDHLPNARPPDPITPVTLSKATFFSFAAMLAVFAVWGLSGFGYPSAPLPYALNVLSKILAFVTALSLFLPQRAEASASRPHPAQAPRSREHAAAAHKAMN